MIDCEHLTDKMPVVVHGGAVWTDEEADHLRDCPSCATEWRVVQAAGRLASSVGDRIDPAVVSRRVFDGVAAAHRRRALRWAGLAAAAVIILLVWTRGPSFGPGTPTADDGAFRLPLAELESLDTGQLRAVLEGMDGPLGGSATPDAPGLGDLENAELERVLRSLEG